MDEKKTPQGLTRRQFLILSGEAAAALAVLSACGGGAKETPEGEGLKTPVPALSEILTPTPTERNLVIRIDPVTGEVEYINAETGEPIWNSSEKDFRAIQKAYTIHQYEEGESVPIYIEEGPIFLLEEYPLHTSVAVTTQDHIPNAKPIIEKPIIMLQNAITFIRNVSNLLQLIKDIDSQTKSQIFGQNALLEVTIGGITCTHNGKPTWLAHNMRKGATIDQLLENAIAQNTKQPVGLNGRALFQNSILNPLMLLNPEGYRNLLRLSAKGVAEKIPTIYELAMTSAINEFVGLILIYAGNANLLTQDRLEQLCDEILNIDEDRIYKGNFPTSPEEYLAMIKQNLAENSGVGIPVREILKLQGIPPKLINIIPHLDILARGEDFIITEEERNKIQGVTSEEILQLKSILYQGAYRAMLEAISTELSARFLVIRGYSNLFASNNHPIYTYLNSIRV